MYKFLNNPYLHGPYMEADKGGGAGGSEKDGEEAGGDDQAGDDSDEDGNENDNQEDKQYTQKDIDDAVKKRLAREKRKWQREQQKAGDGAAKEDKGQEDGESEADQKAKKAEEKAAALEMKWTCLEHEVKKDCVDDVLALAKVHMAKDEGMDIEDAIDEVLKKYPQFKDGYEDSDEENGQDKKGWGQRHGKAQPKSTTVEDEIRKQLFGK